MKKLKKCFVGVMVCLMMGLWALCGAVNAAGTYNMAIMPGHMASVTTYSAFVPLVNEIEQKAGIELKVVVPEDPDALLDLVKKGQVDFIYADAPVYLSIKEYINKDYLLISLTPDMHRTHQAAIIVRKDSKIDSLNDLKGKTFLFGPRFAASKGMAAMALLKKSGIDIDKDLDRYFFDGECENIAMCIDLERVDAGAICIHEWIDENSTEVECGGKMYKIIGKTEYVAYPPFMVCKNVSPALAKKVTDVLINFQDKEILAGIESGAFEKADDKDFESMKKVVDYLK